MKSILLSILIFINTYLFSQNHIIYYTNINFAEKYMLENNLAKADSCFKIAFNVDNLRGFHIDYLLAASNSLKLKDTVSTIRYLLKFSEHGGYYKLDKYGFHNNLLMQTFVIQLNKFIINNDSLYIQLKNNYKNFNNKLNQSLSRTLNIMYFKDQYIARSIFLKLLPVNTQERIMNRIDRKNAKILEQIVLKHGWIDFSQIGEFRKHGKYGLSKLDILLRHHTLEELQKIESYVKASIIKTLYYPQTWASCYDYGFIRYPAYNDSIKGFEIKQKYGTLTTSKNNRTTLFPYGNLNEVNKNRSSLFLDSLSEYCAKRQIKNNTFDTCIITK